MISTRNILLLAIPAAIVAACSSAPKELDANAPMEAFTEKYVMTKDEDEVKGIKKVVIPYFQVEYIVKSAASATAWNDSGNSAQVSQVYELKGVTDETRQAMTDRLYTKLVQDLKTMGVEVYPHEEMVKLESWKAFEPRHKPTPHEIERSGTLGKFYSYQGMPVYFDDGDKRLGVGNMLGQAFSMQKRPPQLEKDLEKETGATVLRVRYVVDFTSRSTAVERHAASVSSSYGVQLVPHGTGFTFKKDGAQFELKAPIAATDDAWVKEVNEINGGKNAAGHVISSLLGQKKSLTEYEIETNVPEWEKTVEQTVATAQKYFLAKIKTEL